MTRWKLILIAAALTTAAPIAKPDLDAMPADYAQTLNRGAQPANWFPWKQVFDAERAAEADRIDDETAEIAVAAADGDLSWLSPCGQTEARGRLHAKDRDGLLASIFLAGEMGTFWYMGGCGPTPTDRPGRVYCDAKAPVTPTADERAYCRDNFGDEVGHG